MTPRDEFERRLDEAYAVFGAGPRPHNMQGCDHCVGEDELRAYETTSPRELTPSQVSHLVDDLGNLVGGKDEVRWFSPRMIAILVENSVRSGLCVEFVGYVIRRGDWPRWPRGEVETLRALTLAAWKLLIHHECEGANLHDGLCAIALFEPDLSAYFDLLDAQPPEVRSLAILELVGGFGASLREQTNPGGFWEDAAGSWEAICVYLRDPDRLADAEAHMDPHDLRHCKKDVYRTLEALVPR